MNLLYKYCVALILVTSSIHTYAQTPNPKFSNSNPEGCAPLNVTFTSAEQGSGYTHTWDFGNGPVVTNGPTNPSRNYTAPGTYTVKHTITGPGGMNTETKTNLIVIHPTPTVAFTATNKSGCPPLNVSFSNQSSTTVPGGLTYNWVLGNGATPGTSNSPNPTATYNTPGTHNVTLQVTNSKGCMASKQEALVTVLDVPNVDFTATPNEFCPGGGTANFTSTVTGQAGSPYTYAWNLGNGTSAVQNPTQAYTGNGPIAYTVSLTVTAANTCTKTVTKTNYIKIHNVTASFTGPTSVCVGEAATFTNTSTAGSTSLWNFGDGPGNTTLKDPSHVYNAPGTYTVSLVSGMGPCSNATTRTIIVRPNPTPQIVMNPGGLCPAPQTISFSTVPAMSSYSWKFQHATGSQNSNAANPSVTYTQNGFFPFELTMTDGFGCKNTHQGVVDIIPLDITTSTNGKMIDSGCVPFLAQFGVRLWRNPPVNDVAYPHGIKKAVWKLGDGNTVTRTSAPFAPIHTYTDSGVFTVTVDVETMNGCMISDTFIVKAGYRPILTDFKATPLVICPKNWVNFVATVKGYSPLVYHWDFGAGNGSKVDDSTATNFYSRPGLYDIKLKVFHRGCPDSLEKKEYVEVLPPKAEFDFKQDCANMLRVSFKDTSYGDSSRYWNFGDGNTSTAEYPVHVYATAGTYNVMLAVYNSKANCHDTIIKPVVVGRNQPVMQANKTKLCKGDSVSFSATESFPSSSAVAFYWYVNNAHVGFTAKNGNQTYTHTFTTPGQYTIKVVSLTVDNQCKDSLTKTNYITVGGPIPGYMADKTKICEATLISFTDTSTTGAGTNIVQRHWDFGTNPPSTSTSSSPNASFTYWTRGDYDVKLVLTDNIGCKDSIIKPKYIKVQKPDAIFTPKNPACAGVEVALNNQSQSAQSYEWTFGDGNTSLESNPKHIYAGRGTYNARLIAIDDLGCRDTSDIPITAIRPVANFTMTDSMSICPPLITGFDASPSVNAKSYWWDFDDGAAPGTKKSHTVAYNNKKEYKVRLVVTDTAGCTDTLMRTAQVLGYEGAFSSDTTEGCVPLTVTFTSNVKGAVPSLIWDFGDGNSMQGSSTQPVVTYTYNKAGSFKPSLIFNNNKGCSVGSDGATILVDDVIPEFETGPACQYSTVKFTNKSSSHASALNSTIWTFHDGTTKIDPTTEFKYGAPGQYRVKLVATNTRGCKDSIERDITINVPVEVNAGADSIICLTDSVQLFPTGGVSYIWSPPGALSCLSCTNPFAYPKVKTKYTVISTDINGCHDTDNIEIGIKTHVTSIVGNGGEICEGEKFSLSVSGARTYLWAPADDLDNATSPTPVATPRVDTRYRVIAYEGKCIPDTSFVNLTVHPKPSVTVRGEQTIVAGTSADLIASGNHITRFLWEPSSTLSCDECADPVASPYKTTKYTVKVFTKYNCVDSADVTITVLCDKSQVFIPNTFTPNGDGMNDVFMVRGNGLSNLKSFRVYSRWGEVLFERTNVTPNDKASGWDGTHNGTQLPPDVYVYIAEVYCENGDLLQLKGDVTIIR